MLPRRWQGVCWTLALAVVLGLPASHQQQPPAQSPVQPPALPPALPQAQSQALQAPQQNVEVAGSGNACRFPGAPAHCTVRFSNESLADGAVATYSCERGFELLGPSRRVCHNGAWTPEGVPFCVLNVAAGKAPMQISTAAGGLPQKAIDGSTSAFYASDTCTLTRAERAPWWYVNLLEPYMVQLVRLDFGKPCCGAGKPATIVVRVGNNRPDLGTNPVCNRFTGQLEEGKPLFLPCNPPLPGAFVSVHLEGPAPTQLSICEAFVYTDQALPIERCPQFRDQPPGSTATYNGKCYIFYSRQPLNFRDALAFCRARGGDLVAESNPALQGFISWELWRRHRSDTASQYWMGAVRDPKDRNNWKWINGGDVTVSFWNLPGGDDDCARYDGSKGWLWSDTNCKASINYICQHQPKACGKPEQPPNSTMVASSFNVGATIEYSCDEGHLLVGPGTRTCLPTGFYDEFPPVCKSIQCGFPADISHGSYRLLNGTVSYLSRVLYSCQEHHRMLGRALLTCDIDERWNGPPPKCQPIECEEPSAIQHGRAVLKTNSTRVGAVVEYGCSTRGYKLLGPKTLTCLPSGLWNQDPPVCKEDVKPPPVGPSGKLPARTSPAPSRPPTSTTVTHAPAPPHQASGAAHVPRIVVASHNPPQPSDTPEGSNSRAGHAPGADLPGAVDAEKRDTLGAKLNLGAIIALGVFGGFVFLAAMITTIVILIRRNRSAKHYRHRASPDCNTVASYDSSSSESRGGLNRYYRQAWENLHQSAGAKAQAHHQAVHAALRRKETMDEPHHAYRQAMGQGLGQGMRDGSELVVTDVAAVYPQGGVKPSAIAAAEKKRHHHHHHHHHGQHLSSNGGGSTRDHLDWRHQHARPQHKRY
ncbi:uncharacterized protein LOC117639872 [Thrips palmi]|uniref:Uncharacterized protein LOC117639872 n=1 Tax=Thrips palmi TaxID=161013 RepID=A0A6P8Y5F0_THRPL|nr:uncharacterized protein LOC117639872 [Thrips palmi]